MRRLYSAIAPLKVSFVGSGNWGSAAAWIAAQNCIRHDLFADEVSMYVLEERVSGAAKQELNEAWKVVTPHLRNGAMDAIGIQLIAAEVGVAISRAEANDAVQEMDLDGNGRIDREEFFTWWENSGKSNIGRLLTSVINRQKENLKYLPGIKLGDNVKAIGSIVEAVEDADLLVFVTPHQFVMDTCLELKGRIKPSAKAISLIKGMEINATGFSLITGVIGRELGLDCSVLMGANIAKEVAEGKFSEATVGAPSEEDAEVWQKLFHTDSFHVRTTQDVAAVEMCGTLKNIVALGAGFADGLEYGNNSKAAILRVGLSEMMRLIKRAFPETKDSTFMESCGIADLITTCYGGRNRKCAEAFVRGAGRRSFEDIEAELLGGQKLQGVLTSNELQHVLQGWGAEDEFPLFTTINRIANGQIPAHAVVHYHQLPTKEDFAGGVGGFVKKAAFQSRTDTFGPNDLK